MHREPIDLLQLFILTTLSITAFVQRNSVLVTMPLIDYLLYIIGNDTILNRKLNSETNINNHFPKQFSSDITAA